jgi:hypothetical protein
MECQLKQILVGFELIYLLNQFKISGRGIFSPFYIHPQNINIINIWKNNYIRLLN